MAFFTLTGRHVSSDFMILNIAERENSKLRVTKRKLADTSTTISLDKSCNVELQYDHLREFCMSILEKFGNNDTTEIRLRSILLYFSSFDLFLEYKRFLRTPKVQNCHREWLRRLEKSELYKKSAPIEFSLIGKPDLATSPHIGKSSFDWEGKFHRVNADRGEEDDDILFIWLGLDNTCQDKICRFRQSYKLFGDRIGGLLDRHVALITLNAFVSTLGGGYFLCRRIEEAERLATYQHNVALQLGDPILASQCRIHLIYNCIQRGHLKRAKKGLLFEWRLGHYYGSETVKSVVRAAWIYLGKLKQIRHNLAKGDVSSKALTRHKFARQMFVRE